MIFVFNIYIFHFSVSLYLCTKIHFIPVAFLLRLVVLSVVLFGLPYGSDQSCSVTLVDHGRGYLGILVSCLICESAIMWLSMRGSILYTQPRDAVQYVIYIRLGKACREAYVFFLRLSFTHDYLLILVRIGWCGSEDYLWFQVKISTLFILIGQILITILLAPSPCSRSPAILLVELVYAVVGIAWLVQYYQPCSDVTAKNLALGR